MVEAVTILIGFLCLAFAVVASYAYIGDCVIKDKDVELTFLKRENVRLEEESKDLKASLARERSEIADLRVELSRCSVITGWLEELVKEACDDE
jgi:hypothetical protein